VRTPPEGHPKRHQTIIDRPLSVIASLTMPTDRPATSTIPGVALAYPRRINPRSNPIVKPSAFSSDSLQPFVVPYGALLSGGFDWCAVRPT
jgi:hypothetical protein